MQRIWLRRSAQSDEERHVDCKRERAAAYFAWICAPAAQAELRSHYAMEKAPKPHADISEGQVKSVSSL